jgi:O-antigen polymerase
MQLKMRKKGPGQHNVLFLVLLTLLCIASFYYFQPNLGGGNVRMPYTYPLWVAAMAVILAGVILFSSSSRIVLPRYWPGLVALPVCLLISGLFADMLRPVEWAVRLAFIFGGFLFLFSLFQFRLDRRGIESLLFLLAVAGLLHTGVAYIQLFDSDWLFGWIPPSNKNETQGMFQQYNLLAIFAATSLVIALYLTTTAGFRSRPLLYRSLIYANVLLQPAIILASGSRAGLLGLLVGVALLIASRYRFLLRRKKNLLILFTALSLGLGYGYMLSGNAKRMKETLSRDGYQEGRVVVYQLTWELVKEKPLFGHGIGSFPKVFQEKRIEFQKLHPEAKSHQAMYVHPHNEVLYWLVEAGLVSVLGMLLFSIATLRQLFRLGWQRGMAYLAMIAPITLHTLVELPFYLSSFHWFVWLLLLYLIHSHYSAVHSVRLSVFAKRLVPVASLGVILVVATFLFSTLQSLRGMTFFALRGERNMSMIESATKNPVLNELALLFALRVLLYSDISRGTTQYLDRFISWSERFVEDLPEPDVLSDLALAYSYRNDPENAQRIIDRAVSIYPNNSYLVEQQRQIRAGAAVDYFRKTKIRGSMSDD